VLLADALLSDGKTAAGMRTLAAARQLGADSWGYWATLSQALARTGRAAEACEAARRAVDLAPTPALWALLAAREANAGRLAVAQAAAREAIRLNPYDADARRLARQLLPAR